MAVEYGRGRVKASLDTRMVEVERYCVILENWLGVEDDVH